MKQIVTALLLFTATAFHGFGQKLQWSLPQRVSEHAYIIECIGNNAGGLFVVKKTYRTQNHNIIIERYSDDMRTTINKVFAGHRNENFLNVILDSTGLRMFYAEQDKDKKQVNVRLRNINFNLNVTGKDTTLFTIPGITPDQALITVNKIRQKPDVLITWSADQGEYPVSYSYLMLDGDYQKTSSGSFGFEPKSKNSIEQVCFTKDLACLLVREDVGTQTVKQGYRFSIYELHLATGETKRSDLYNDKYVTTEGLLKTDYKNNAMVFAGLYATSDSSYVKGFCVWKISLADNVSSFNNVPFPTDIVAEMEGRRTKVQGIFNLRAGDLNFRADGGLILTSEEYQETHENISELNAYGVAQPNVRNFYYYENLLVLSISPANALDWHTVIRKDQVTVNDNGTFSSYMLCVLPDRLVYLYNDLTRKNWDLTAAEVDDKGSSSTSILVSPQNYDGRMIPQYGEQVGYNQFIVPAVTQRGIVILKVTY